MSPTGQAIVTIVAFVVVLVVIVMLARWAYRGMDRYNDHLRQENARPITSMRYRRLWVIDRDLGADAADHVERHEHH